MLLFYDPGCLSLKQALQLPAYKVTLAACREMALQPNMSGP